eukprot:364536-Chlamydomonas_euryale.AAC.17
MPSSARRLPTAQSLQNACNESRAAEGCHHTTTTAADHEHHATRAHACTTTQRPSHVRTYQANRNLMPGC